MLALAKPQLPAEVPIMGEMSASINRGSEWHRWEPHIHAPGTVLADRYQKDSWSSYLDTLEAVSPALRVIGVTDYCITRSYERVKAEKDKGRLKQCDLLFPNIELRLNTGTVKGNFVNIHLLASPETPDHIAELNRFLGRLHFEAFDDRFACTPSELIRLGRKADASKADDEAAQAHGCSQFKVSRENLMEAYDKTPWAKENILIAVAGNADGTSGVREAADTVMRQEIEKAAHAIFASSPKQRDFWLGHGASDEDELKRRYNGLKPCLWGCDAHELARVGNPDGDRFCWIKGAPTFDALRQACIDPERAFVGAEPPLPALESQIISEITIENAPWALTPKIRLNPGLVAVIGPRGSGKTALVDVIAAGADAYVESEARPSFLARAREHLDEERVLLSWKSEQTPTTRSLAIPVSFMSDAHPRVRYLSQQFVEELCSNEGMPTLIKEIERVIFEAHPVLDRDGAADFDELLDTRACTYRDTRDLETASLAEISDQIGVEMEKTRLVAGLRGQITEKQRLIAQYQTDRKNLLPKKENKTGERLQHLIDAAENVRGNIRYFSMQQTSVTAVTNEVRDLRQNRAPATLRSMQERHPQSLITPAEWQTFLLNYQGDVDQVLTAKTTAAATNVAGWKGKPPTAAAQADGAFLLDNADLAKTTLAVPEAEIGRLGKLVTADKLTADRLAAVSKRISDETVSLTKLQERLVDCESARARANALVASREQGYIRVFDAIVGEETVLRDLYAPLMQRLSAAGGTLAKLSFSVARAVDVEAWAAEGEKLFDKRGGPFKGIGSLTREAYDMLAPAWESGNSASIAAAMNGFRAKHTEVFIENAPYPRTDQANYRPWSRRFAQWLYSTKHISIEYGIKYDGIDIHKLSPGTRGIVLVLLYLALDDGDDRPLIIDQPEENLDPQSIYAELVPLFQAAKRKRQVIMVTHNANLVINTDADQIIIAEVGPHIAQGLPPITYRSGGLDEASIRKRVCDILEGGERAFQDRARRLRISLQR
jgi:AAA domain, putative AbiEii toxin, Type IV TA system